MVYDKSVAYPETPYLLNRLGQVSRSRALLRRAGGRADVVRQHGRGQLPAGRRRVPDRGTAASGGVHRGGHRDQRRRRRRPTSPPSAGAASPSPTRPASATPSRPRGRVSRSPPPGTRPRRHHLHRATSAIWSRGEPPTWSSSRARRSPADTSRCCSRSGPPSAPSSDRTEFSEAVATRALQVHRLQGRVRGGPAADRSAVRRLRPVRDSRPAENLTYKLHPPMLRALGRKKKIGLGPRSPRRAARARQGKAVARHRVRPVRLRARPQGGARTARRVRAHRDRVGRRARPATNYDRAVEIAALPDVVRGYEDVKLANVEAYRARLRELGVTPPANS